MLTLQDLKDLLDLNSILLQAERRSYRQAELLTHRAIVKDMIIEELEKALIKAQFNEMLKRHNYKQVG